MPGLLPFWKVSRETCATPRSTPRYASVAIALLRLDQQILEAVQAQDLEDLRPKVVELLELTPQREDLRRLLGIFNEAR